MSDRASATIFWRHPGLGFLFSLTARPVLCRPLWKLSRPAKRTWRHSDLRASAARRDDSPVRTLRRRSVLQPSAAAASATMPKKPPAARLQPRPVVEYFAA